MEKADELFGEINDFLTDNTVASEAGENDPDEDALPYESLADFSTAPAEFSEMAERMLHRVENLFDLTAVYNRHSAKYLKACVLLEKGIRFLGSACITKIALELRDHSFPKLSQLTTMKLYRMASFNYRKLDAALTEKIEHGNDLYPELLDMEFRYFNLLRRLRSTETKIHNYHINKYYKEENYSPVVEGNAFTSESWTKCYTQDKEEAPAFRKAPAFPLIKSSEFGVQRKEKNLKRKAKSGNVSTQNAVRRTQKTPASKIEEHDAEEAVKAEKISSRSEADPMPKDACRSYTDAGGKVHIDVSGLRQRLMKDAHESGDPDLMMEIAGEPPEKLYERYRRKYGGIPRSGPSNPSHSGPSAEKRKKLRKKRKSL